MSIVGVEQKKTASPFGEAVQPVKEVSPSCKLFGIMEKKRTGGKKNGTVATG